MQIKLLWWLLPRRQQSEHPIKLMGSREFLYVAMHCLEALHMCQMACKVSGGRCPFVANCPCLCCSYEGPPPLLHELSMLAER